MNQLLQKGVEAINADNFDDITYSPLSINVITRELGSVKRCKRYAALQLSTMVGFRFWLKMLI